jgi:hypothetical protein
VERRSVGTAIQRRGQDRDHFLPAFPKRSVRTSQGIEQVGECPHHARIEAGRPGDVGHRAVLLTVWPYASASSPAASVSEIVLIQVIVNLQAPQRPNGTERARPNMA